MPSSENALIQFENASPTLVDFTQLTDQGDNQTFKSTHELWSKQQGMAPDVKPNGLATGGQVTPGSADDSVDVAALTCYLAGVLTSVSAASGEALTRATTDTHIVNSVTITSAGAIAVIQGSEGTSFSEARGAAGGPPWIPSDSIEIAQVRLSEQSAAPVASSEIYTQEGLHKERFDSPMWDEVTAEVESMIQGYAGIRFYQALPEIHSDDSGSTTATKAVYAKYSIPNFTDLAKGVDFKPPEISHSVSSTQIYGMTLGSKSSSLNQGSFTAYLETNIKDELVKQKDKNLWFKFYPDRYNEGHILCQGFLGLDRNFPADSPMNASATISAEQKAMEVAG